MKKVKKSTILVIILSVLLIIIAGFLLTRTEQTGEAIKETEKEKDKAPTDDTEPTTIDGSGGSETSDSGTSEGASSSSTSSTETSEPVELPSDLHEKGCGYYFPEYGICTGFCETGTCTQEGRSCYCKN